MAFVPKRDPCVVCNNPVFFAERLVIENQLYHTNCLKCARCSTVLTLGNFYQTEKDNEFCCETCPDEEITNLSSSSSSSANKNGETNRLSIAQRIALFERESSSVLKKSLSDEEKSKSLNRQLQSSSSKGLSNFLSTQINKEETEIDGSEQESADEMQSDDEEILEKPQAPSIELDLDTLLNREETAQINQTIRPIQEVKSSASIIEKTNDEKNSVNEPNTIIDEAIANIVKEDSNEMHDKVQDEIELEFEKLAEEAVTSVISTKINQVYPQKPLIALEPVLECISNNTEQTVSSLSDNIYEAPQLKKSVDIVESPNYPEDKNPFDDDDGEEEKKSDHVKRPSLNPFGSCSEDDDEETDICNKYNQTIKEHNTLPKPPRPPPPKKMEIQKPISTNPFDSEDEEDKLESTGKELSHTKLPVPTPRRLVPSLTPEPSLRNNLTSSPAQSFKGSSSSLASSTDGLGLRRKKKKAPLPPTAATTVINLLGSKATKNEIMEKTPTTTPKKKRPAPTPPTSSTPLPLPIKNDLTHYVTANDSTIPIEHSVDNSLTNESNESNEDISSVMTGTDTNDESQNINNENESSRRKIPLEESLIDSSIASTSSGIKLEEEVTYRRKIIPLSTTQNNDDSNNDFVESLKDNKEAENRQRQSQYSLNDSMPYLNKSSHGKWKRRKGPAPALPGFAQPQKRILQMLPLQEIRHELEIIEVQQQGLEKQGVQLEKMIRERCEGDNRTTEELLESLPTAKNPKEVEDLILQLFEIVNEKNELFRRQAELMYLRRAHRLEEEQADVEFEIRTLMAQPECNKTDSDKTREEALIARLVEIVQLRNEVVDCLEMDRQRAADEDMSIKQRMESHTAKLDHEYLNQTPTKLSKKEKKKLKETKKLKNKKLNDADKDLDTSELKGESSEKKKKKKKFLF